MSCPTSRDVAIAALGQPGSDHAVATLTEIATTGAAATAVAAIEALSETSSPPTIAALRRLVKALWTIAKEGTPRDRQAVLRRLIKSGRAEAIDLVVRSATSGSEHERVTAMQMLAEAGTRDAVARLVDVARAAQGALRPQSLEIQSEVYYRMSTGGSDQRLASACVRPVSYVSCGGVIDSRGVALSLYIQDYDWVYANLQPPSFQPTLQQSDICQDPADNNYIAWPVCSGVTSSMITLYEVGPDRCAFLEP